MRKEARQAREEQIEVAAYQLLAENGYAGTSMLSIAKKAKASNETLYRWYGDKQGLFKAMVTRNAEGVRRLLEADIAIERSPPETIQSLGPKLLGLLTGDRAIALNRAAAADPSGELGQAITASGRATILPLIVKVFEAARKSGLNTENSAREVAEIYINLLVGDLQIRRAIGAANAPTKREIQQRADKAWRLLLRAVQL